MFVNIIEFPPIKSGKNAEFIQWFEWSNSVYREFDGFISRTLLKPTQGDGHYLAIVEHQSEQTFMAMHASPARAAAWERVNPLLEGKPTPHFYEVVAEALEGRRAPSEPAAGMDL